MSKGNMWNKQYMQKCCVFIGFALVIISIPFWLITSPEWCVEVAYILAMAGFVIVVVTWIHQIIFWDW